MISNKILGHFEPFILKQIFHPDSPTAYKYAISQLKEVYFTKEQQLIHYINAVYKVCMFIIQTGAINNNVAVAPSIETLEILERILSVKGVVKLIQI